MGERRHRGNCFERFPIEQGLDFDAHHLSAISIWAGSFRRSGRFITGAHQPELPLHRVDLLPDLGGFAFHTIRLADLAGAWPSGAPGDAMLVTVLPDHPVPVQVGDRY